jgi:hypothetical protein
MKRHIRFGVWISLMALVWTGSILACQLGGSPLVGGGVVRGSGNVVEESRAVSGFAAVALAGSGQLIIEVGKSESLRIEAEDNLMQYLQTRVRNGTLEIGTQQGISLTPTQPIRFYLTAVELDTIAISGSSEVEAPNLQAAQFSVTVSGSGDVEIAELHADTLTVVISGSGDVSIAGGKVDEQEITLSGSGKYTARNLKSTRAEVHTSGSANVTIRASEHLQATISGSGNVRYLGNPTVESKVSGSGDIERIGE